VNQGYYGLENLALIPGSVGAAPIQNIGAYGVELESCFEFLCGIDLTTEQEVTLRREDCQFGYRDSIFKHALKDKIIITSVALKLSKVPELVLDYPALAQSIDQSATSVSAKQVAETVIAIRQSKLPDPIDVPNAGSFYKNPIVLEKKYSALKNEYPELVAYPLGSGQYKLAAGWLLDKAGWKGKVIDGINMHDKQALVLTNPYHASGKTILDFSERLCQSIQDQFGVSLEIEPQIY
jgi:UDP-N-acetylmuramate dehydrogenase